MDNLPLIASNERAKIDFAQRAAKYLNNHPEARSFSDGNPEHGKLFALRWAPTDSSAKQISLLVFELPYDAVVVGDLDQDHDDHERLIDELSGFVEKLLEGHQNMDDEKFIRERIDAINERNRT